MEYRAITKEDPQKDLTHWKYIKRAKKNGKWRYYYDKERLKDDLGFNKREEYKTAEQTYDKALDTYRKKARDTRDFEKQSNNLSAKEYNYERSHDLYRSENYWKEVTEKRLREYSSAKTDYYKTPIGSIEKYVEKGKQIVEKLFVVS